jgi:hypothetical protein
MSEGLSVGGLRMPNRGELTASFLLLNGLARSSGQTARGGQGFSMAFQWREPVFNEAFTNMLKRRESFAP